MKSTLFRLNVLCLQRNVSQFVNGICLDYVLYGQFFVPCSFSATREGALLYIISKGTLG